MVSHGSPSSCGSPAEALSLAVYCHYIAGGEIPRKYAGRVARTYDELGELPERGRVFGILIGHKPVHRNAASSKRGVPSSKWLATEIIEIVKEV
jgi:hypothetical protein